MDLMEFKHLKNPEIIYFITSKIKDKRGYFEETYNKEILKSLGFDFKIYQENTSYSKIKGTLRGLHFQRPPFEQAKIVRVLQGSIYDVAIDLRRSSPYFGKHIGIIISSSNYRQIIIPKGFAHGFLTLEDNTLVNYKVDAPYSPVSESGIIWDDKDLKISWPEVVSDIVISSKDLNLKSLKEISKEEKLF